MYANQEEAAGVKRIRMSSGWKDGMLQDEQEDKTVESCE